MTDWFPNLLWPVLAYVAFTAFQVAFRKRSRFAASIALPLNLFLLCTVLEISVARRLVGAGQYSAILKPAIRAALLVAAIYLGVCLVDKFVLGFLVPHQIHKSVPVVLRGLFRLVLLAIGTFVVLKTVFPNVNLSVLAVSSIVAGYILGNASQDTLGNLFAGLALNAERPFSIGDWIEVGTVAGQVVEITWRATWLRTKTNDQVVIPNSVIAREMLVNYSRPTPVHGVVTKIGVSYSAAPNKVREVLRNVLRTVPGVLADPEPRIWLHEYSDFTMNYTVKFYITDFEHREDILSRVFDLIWYNFKREGILIPFPIRVQWTRDTLLARNEAARRAFCDECRAVVKSVDIFRPLSTSELEKLISELREEVYSAGEDLVRQGEDGDSFYLILSGLARVSVAGPSGCEVTVAHLGRGGFFGEMSLLTGEKRSATVTAETDTRVAVLSHATLKSLLSSNPALADGFAVELVRRSREQATVRQVVPEAGAPTPPSHGVLLTRILRFFGLTNRSDHTPD